MKIVNKLSILLCLLLMLHQKMAAQQVSPSQGGVVLLSKKTDKSLVAPVAEEPTRVCQMTQQAWAAYLQTHRNFKTMHPMSKDGLAFISCIVAEINSRVKMILLKKDSYSKLGIEFYSLLKPVLEKSKWTPLYKKKQNARLMLQTEVFVCFSFNPAYKMSIRMTDLRTGDDILNCDE